MTMTADVVLVAHHDERMRATAGEVLAAEGLRVVEAPDWPAALRQAAEERSRVLIVAARLAGTDVLERLGEPRDAGVLGVLVLTANQDEIAIALDAGADDCVSEATIDRDLAPRVRALIRRVAPRPPAQQLAFGDLVIDITAREVWVRDTIVALTSREFELLVFLASQPRTVFTRAELLENVWGVSPGGQSLATVTEHVRRLRLKLEGDEHGVRWLRTVRGVGYAFRP
jgi:two-component system phosphate regulon response regulator PhoB